ncbi:MAG: GntR family transcriptional regulator [Pseudomonadota bacterium]
MNDTANTTIGDATKAVAELVANVLRDRIVKGELAPLDRLVERKLSAELAVSRTPVREALKLLEADGLIEISLHRGAQVVPYLSVDAQHLFDVISVLEGLAARRFAENLNPEILQRLENLHAEMLSYHQAGQQQAYFDINTVIHDLIVEACDNPVLAETHKRLIARARRGRFLAIMEPDRLAQAVSEHEAVMQAFRDRDAEAAARIWELHLRHTGSTVTDVLHAQETADAL